MTAVTLTARDVCAALHRRYNKPNQGRPGEQYVCIEEARAGAGFDGNNGRCDFLALNTWKSRGMELIGHEIKVSLSDWHAELTHPEKAERFARYCRRWFVAAPANLASRIANEVPPAWGLLSVSAKGRATEIRAAQTREPEPVPEWWWLGWLAQIDRQHKRTMSSQAQAALAQEREVMRKELAQEIEGRAQLRLELDNELRRNVAALRQATGIDLNHLGPSSFDRLRAVWQLAHGGRRLEALVADLRRAADSIETATTTSEEVATACSTS